MVESIISSLRRMALTAGDSADDDIMREVVRVCQIFLTKTFHLLPAVTLFWRHQYICEIWLVRLLLEASILITCKILYWYILLQAEFLSTVYKCFLQAEETLRYDSLMCAKRLRVFNLIYHAWPKTKYKEKIKQKADEQWVQSNSGP